MKTLFLTTVLAALTVEAFTQQLNIGARFDASAMKWTFSDHYEVPIEYPFTDGSVKSLWGFQISLPVEYRLNNWFGFQTEIGFAKRGFALKLSGYEQGCDITATAKSTFRYFDFPLLLKTYLSHGAKEFYLLAGPSYSKVRDAKIHVSVTASCNGDSSSDSDSQALDLDDYPKTKTDFGLYGGLGYSKGDDRLRVFLEGRYYYGLKKQSEEGVDENIYNRGVMFSAGIMFRVLHK